MEGIGSPLTVESGASPPVRWWVLLLPLLMVLIGILLATAAAVSGQDVRRARDQTQLEKDRFYWENELAQAELAHASRPKIAEIGATLDKVKANKLISYAQYGRQFTQWDGYRYEEIVDLGYLYHMADDPENVKDDSFILRPGWPEKRAKNVVWYPLYPLLGWVVKTLTGLPTHWALTTVSWISAGGGSILVFLFARRHYRERRTLMRLGTSGEVEQRIGDLSREEMAAMWALAALLFGPCSIFLYANFTESLFVMLLAAFLCCLQRRWWWRAALVAAVASNCRSQGVLFGPILALAFLIRGREVQWARKLAIAAALGFVSAIGLMCYGAFCRRNLAMGWRSCMRRNTGTWELTARRFCMR